MMDMSDVIVAKSDQFNGPDLLGAPMTVTIASVRKTGKEQAVEIRLVNESKVWRPNKNTVRTLVAGWGNDAEKWAGRSVMLFYDPNVTYGKLKPGGIRISHMSHLSGDLVICLPERRGSLKECIIKPLAAQSPAPARAPVESAPQPETTAFVDDEAAAEWTNWAMGMIGAVAKADRAKLARLQQTKADELATLAADYPKLHSDVMAAIADRNAVLDAEGGNER